MANRRRVAIALVAADDPRRARDWMLQPGSGPDARRRWAALRAAARARADRPQRGRVGAGYPGHRGLVVSGWRLLHHVRPDTGDVEIVRVLGPGRRAVLL